MVFLMDTTAFHIVYFTEMGINVFFFIINILVSVFLCAEWTKSKSIFKSAYFYLLNSFFILNIPFTFFWVYGRTIFYALDNPLLPEVLVVQWYVSGCKGIWEAVMGLSRCTALAFPALHTKVSPSFGRCSGVNGIFSCGAETAGGSFSSSSISSLSSPNPTSSTDQHANSCPRELQGAYSSAKTPFSLPLSRTFRSAFYA